MQTRCCHKCWVPEVKTQTRQGEADAAKIRNVANADADRIKAIGAADASRIEMVGEATAKVKATAAGETAAPAEQTVEFEITGK